MPSFSRRRFLSTTASTVALGLSASLGLSAPPGIGSLWGAAPTPRLKKAVKFGMIRTSDSVEGKFRLIQSLGFEGVELDSPSSINRDEVVAAVKKTGVVVHGVVDSIHWKIRLSDPNPKVRAEGLAGLQTAIRDCKLYRRNNSADRPG